MPISTPQALAGTAPPGSDARTREALGRSQGGFSIKLHVCAEGHGRPMTTVLSSGERNEQIALEPLIDCGALYRSGAGRARLRPHRLTSDRGYSSPAGGSVVAASDP